MARARKPDSSIDRKTRRKIQKSAKATASHHWLPTDSQPEPHWVTEWDGQIKAAIRDRIGAHELEIVPLLQVIARFNDAAVVTRPGKVVRTPESRWEHQQWDTYQQLRDAANQAIVDYEQRQEILKRDIEASIDQNHSGRGVFYSKLTEYHQRPAEVKDVHKTPLTFEAVYGSEAMRTLRRAEQSVQAARTKLNNERESASHSDAAAQNASVDGHAPSPGIQSSNGDRPATAGDSASPANQEFVDGVDPQLRGEHSGDVTAVNGTQDAGTSPRGRPGRPVGTWASPRLPGWYRRARWWSVSGRP
jgi:hypothetical protein